jgi:hypothetical protein
MPNLVQLLRRYERGRRFWQHVDVRGRDECWRWLGNGALPWPARPDERAWELARGPLPDGARLEHRCGTDACVNPDHMDVVAR